MAKNFTDWMNSLMHYGIPGMRKGFRKGIRQTMQNAQNLPQQYLNRQAQMAAQEKLAAVERNRVEQQVTTQQQEEEEKRRRQRHMDRKGPSLPGR